MLVSADIDTCRVGPDLTEHRRKQLADRHQQQARRARKSVTDRGKGQAARARALVTWRGRIRSAGRR